LANYKRIAHAVTKYITNYNKKEEKQEKQENINPYLGRKLQILLIFCSVMIR